METEGIHDCSSCVSTSDRNMRLCTTHPDAVPLAVADGSSVPHICTAAVRSLGGGPSGPAATAAGEGTDMFVRLRGMFMQEGGMCMRTFAPVCG